MEINDYNITVIGDSISKGIFIDDELKIKKLETNAVNVIENKFNIKILNNSKYGQSLKRVIDKKIIDEYLDSIDINKKNLLVISLGGNDADYDWEKVGINPSLSHGPKTSYQDFKKYLDDMTKTLKNNNIKIVFITLFPLNNEYYFNNIINKISDGKNVLKFLNNDISNLSRHQELFNNAIIENAIKNKCEIIDLRSVFLNDINYLNYCSKDGIHPNELGQEYIANIVSDYIQ